MSVYLNDEEKARLDELASQLRLKRSDFIRRLVMSYRMPNAEDFQAWQGIRDLMKVNADLARLGNLIKMIADDLPGDLAERYEALLGELARTQEEVKAAAMDVRKSIAAGSR
ncbi:MAG: ribbon-helix-helix protein, CopG family [Rhodospirillales bacterium]